jgi:hypothetical protein
MKYDSISPLQARSARTRNKGVYMWVVNISRQTQDLRKWPLGYIARATAYNPVMSGVGGQE